MASLIAQYRQIIEKTFQDYADFLDTDRQIQIELEILYPSVTFKLLVICQLSKLSL